jgi:hypothetical protein
MTAFDTWWNVEVRDDHDGGSVWYVHEDYLDTRDGAEDLAARVSRVRDNKAARVTQVTATVLATFDDGKAVDP